MTSGITNAPLLPAPAGYSLTVEYTLKLDDYHALDMFLFDTIVRGRARFQLIFYGTNLLKGGGVAAIAGLMLWSILKTIGSTLPPSPYRDARLPLQVGCAGALLTVAVILIGLIPGSFLHQANRAANVQRFRRARLLQWGTGFLSDKRRFRVLMTPDWFLETVEYRETGIAVEITEHKETRVWWAAVTSIDITAAHVFFTVKDKGWLIVPRTAFVDGESFRAFVILARTFQKAARTLRAPHPEAFPPPETRIAGESVVKMI